MKNQPQRFPARGVATRRLDHFNLLAVDVAAIRDFCRRECGTQEQREELTKGYTEAHNDGLYRKMAELGWLGLPFAATGGVT